MFRHFCRYLRVGLLAGLTAWMLGGCGWGHHHKSSSYDRAVSDEDHDPTYRDDPQRADEEVRDAQ